MYLGNIPQDQYLSVKSQQITGNGGSSYSLDYAVSTPEEIAVFVNNVRQNVSTYTVSGTSLTLGGTISASDSCWVLFLGRTVGTKTPAVGSVTNAMLQNSSITLNGSAVSLGGSATVNGIFETQLLHVRDEKSSGTAGGTSSTGTNTRDLNTIKTNEITGASLSSNQITLPSGTYYLDASTVGFNHDRQRLYLYNTSDSSVEVIGQVSYCNAGGSDQNIVQVRGRFTISAQKVFEIRHWVQSGTSGNGLGVDDGNQSSLSPEVYTDVTIWKVA